MRVVKDIYKIQPLQIDTVELIPGSSIEGTIGTPVNIVGNSLAEKVTLTANALPKVDANLEIEVVVAGATGTGSYKVRNVDTGFESGIILTSADANSTIISGVDVTIADTSGETAGNKVAVNIIGDQTYIIPGTVVGKVASGVNNGKWRPIHSNDSLTDFSQFRVVSNFQETDKSKTVLPAGYELNLSDVYVVDVIVYGQILESAVKAINLDAVSGLKEKMPFYVWL